MDLLTTLEQTNRDSDLSDGRFPYLTTGVVTSVESVDKQGRVKARLSSMEAGEESEWLSPGLGGGLECVAQKNDPIIVQFHHGDPNRGFYWTYIDSKTQNRAQDYAALGNALCGLYNGLADAFNQLCTAFNAQKYANGGSPAPFLVRAAKAKDAKGSPVSGVSCTLATIGVNDKVALSGRVKVGK